MAIKQTPAAAGIPLEVLDRVAEESIHYEAAEVAAIAALAGVPGGLALTGTVPADTAQNLAHMLRVAQKLAYLYSWPELFDDDGNEPDDATQGVSTLFGGVMFGATAASEGVSALSKVIAQQVAKELPKKALTKGAVHPIVKIVATRLSVDMTKQIFAKGLAKVIP